MKTFRRLIVVVCLTLSWVARADVLIGTNDERFVGRVIEESTDAVVFESAIGGRLTVPRGQIRELQRTPAAETPAVVPPAASSVISTQTVSSMEWVPPGVGHDGFDWIQLKSGEWLKGRLKYVQEKNVEFDSDELEEMTLKLKDVRKIYAAKPMYTKFEGREPIHGIVVISNEVVIVDGEEPLRLPRDDLTGITPGGKTGIKNWSGKASVGLNLQSGNTKETTLNISTELDRRTPATEFLLTYLGNFSEVNGAQNANNDRVDANYDIRLNRHWFVRALQSEYYHDPLANIDIRGSAGVGLGYTIFDEDGLEWWVAAGPSYQYTQYETVETNHSSSVNTPAAVLQSRFKADITKRLDLILSYRGTATSDEAGLYAHHAVSTLEFEVKHHLNLDVSFVWDYLQRPQAEDNGVVPDRSDYLLILGVGASF